MCTKKWPLLVVTDEAVGVKVSATGDSPNPVEIFPSHWRKVESEKKGFRRSGFTPKTERYGRTSYVASVGTCQVISKTSWHWMPIKATHRGILEALRLLRRARTTMLWQVQDSTRTLFFCRSCKWWTWDPRWVRRYQQSNPLCESEKVHSLDCGEHWEWSKVGHLIIPLFSIDLIYLSGGSYAGTKPSKTDSIMI